MAGIQLPLLVIFAILVELFLLYQEVPKGHCREDQYCPAAGNGSH